MTTSTASASHLTSRTPCAPLRQISARALARHVMPLPDVMEGVDPELLALVRSQALAQTTGVPVRAPGGPTAVACSVMGDLQLDLPPAQAVIAAYAMVMLEVRNTQWWTWPQLQQLGEIPRLVRVGDNVRCGHCVAREPALRR